MAYLHLCRWRQFHCAADVGPCSVGSFFGIQLLGLGETVETGRFFLLLGDLSE